VLVGGAGTDVFVGGGGLVGEGGGGGGGWLVGWGGGGAGGGVSVGIAVAMKRRVTVGEGVTSVGVALRVGRRPGADSV
jgi:hypothetical protein